MDIGENIRTSCQQRICNIFSNKKMGKQKIYIFLILKFWHKLFPIAKPTLDALVTTGSNVEEIGGSCYYNTLLIVT